MEASGTAGEQTMPDAACDQAPFVDERRAHQFECGDPQEFTAGVRDWNWDLTRLGPGEFRACVEVIRIEAVTVTRLRFSHALLHRIRPPRGDISMLLFDQSTQAVFVDSYGLETGEGVLLEELSSADVISRGSCVVVAISVSELDWSRTTRLSRHGGVALRGGSRLLTCKRAALCALLDAANSVIDAFVVPAEPSGDSGTRRSACERLLARLNELAMEPSRRHEPSGLTQRMIGVQRARDYIEKHLAESISLTELCRHTHLQARTLEYGFREIVGLSPMGYIKMLRLGEVRRRLLSTIGDRRTISDVALDAGFLHVCQFGAEYKKIFSESPSSTRGRLTGQIRRPRASKNGDSSASLASVRAAEAEAGNAWVRFLGHKAP